MTNNIFFGLMNYINNRICLFKCKSSLRFHYLYNIYFSNFISFIINNHLYYSDSILYTLLSLNYRPFMLGFLLKKKKLFMTINCFFKLIFTMYKLLSKSIKLICDSCESKLLFLVANNGFPFFFFFRLNCVYVTFIVNQSYRWFLWLKILF